MSTHFERSLKGWTLAFADPAEESKFLEQFNSVMRIIPSYRLMVFGIYVFQVIFRIYRLIAAINDIKGIQMGTPQQETLAVCVIVPIVIIELVLWWRGWLKKWQGFLPYLTVPNMATLTSFYTQKIPAYGVM